MITDKEYALFNNLGVIEWVTPDHGYWVTEFLLLWYSLLCVWLHIPDFHGVNPCSGGGGGG
jgi:hypothetical protein